MYETRLRVESVIAFRASRVTLLGIHTTFTFRFQRVLLSFRRFSVQRIFEARCRTRKNKAW